MELSKNAKFLEFLDFQKPSVFLDEKNINFYKMYKALVIGCGNIGAMYDFENNEIQTHTKALVLNGNFQVDVFDIDTNLAQKVTQKYQIHALKEINQIEQYDLVSICTPTDTHISYLNQ